MPGATRRSAFDVDRSLRDRGGAAEGGGSPSRHPHVFPRYINVVWASIVAGDIFPGELVFNENDDSLVVREGPNIHRFDKAGSRTI